MKKLVVFLMVAGLVIGGIGLAQAAYVSLSPADLTAPGSYVPGTTKYTWDDGGAPAPIGSYAVGGAPGFGDSSWYSDVSGSSTTDAVPYNGRPYTVFRLYTDGIFGGPVTVSQLSDITYWSNFVGGEFDWQVKIYTKPTAGAVSGAWYNTRFEYNRGNQIGAGWQLQSANALGQLGVSYVDKNLTSEYTNEEIMFIDIAASYANNSPPSYTYLDGVTISLKDNRSQCMDLTAVPEPATMLLLGLGLVGLAGIRRKFRS